MKEEISTNMLYIGNFNECGTPEPIRKIKQSIQTEVILKSAFII